MKRLTTNKNVSDMGMYELAHNCCYAKDRTARYRDFEMDMDARDFARNLMTTLTDDELPVDDDAFDEEVLENLQYDPFGSVIGLIALFYRNLWAMADLRERLQAYEDTNLTPEQFAEFDKMYLAKCEEVNRLTAELEEVKKPKQGDLISRSTFAEEIKSLEVTVVGLRASKGVLHEYMKQYRESVLRIIDEQPTAYDVGTIVNQLEEKQMDIVGNTSLHHLYSDGFSTGIECAIDIINQLAEEYKNCALCYLGSPCEYQNPEADCEKCEEYNNEKHYCPKFCKVITEAVEEIEENHNNDFCEWKEISVGGITVVKEPHRMRLFNHDHEQHFCHYCGKKIKVAPYQPKGE